METRFVEAGQAPAKGGNWGRFMVARLTTDEWHRPSHFPDRDRAEAGLPPQKIMRSTGWHYTDVIVWDLVTGEGAMFVPGGIAQADLQKHQIWVCPMFEPFLSWLYEFIAEHGVTWLEELPAVVTLPDAAFDTSGYRRPGPKTVAI